MIRSMDSREFATYIAQIADDKQAENILILDVHAVSGITDYFVVVTGTSEPHLKAIVSEIQRRTLADHGLDPYGTDGKLPTSWCVIDYFDVIVHVMTESARSFYALENLWKDAPSVKLNSTTVKKLPTDQNLAISE